MNETQGKKKTLKTQTRKQSQNIGLITILNIGGGGLARKQTINSPVRLVTLNNTFPLLSLRTYKDGKGKGRLVNDHSVQTELPWDLSYN